MNTSAHTGAITGPRSIDDPPFARFLFSDVTVMPWVWLVVRVYLAYQWLEAGIGKLGSPAWIGAHAGAAIVGFAKRGLAETQGAHPDVTGWYAVFLRDVVIPNAGWLSPIIVYGEIAVGLGLLLGGLTGIAAFFGITMNLSYLLGGTLSINPVLAILGMLIVLAWKNAGWIGLDRWLLPALGTPWQPGAIALERQREHGGMAGVT